MIDYLRRYINSQSIYDYEKADVILNILFACIDFLIIVLTVTVFSSNNKDITDLCYQLVGIFFVDIIVRLYHIYILQKYGANAFLKEIISVIFGADLFYLSFSLFTQIIKVLKLKIKLDIIMPSILYVLVFFSYEKIISYHPITFNSYIISFSSLILLTQSMFSIIYIYYIYDMIKAPVVAVVSEIYKGEKKLNIVNRFILGAPASCLLLYILHYLIKILLLFFKSPMALLYGTITLNIFRDGAKYFAFGCCEIIVYALNTLVVKETRKKKDGDEVEIINE